MACASPLGGGCRCKRVGCVQIPRVELVEMGPSLDLALRRLQPAGPDLQREAMKQPKLTKKKVRLL